MAGQPRDVNPIDVVEAAYDLEATDREWLRAVATAVRPFVDGERGMFAYTFDASLPPDDLRARVELWDMERETFPDVGPWVAAHPEFARFVHSQNDGLLSMLDLCRRAGITDLHAELPPLAGHFDRFGLADLVAFQTVEPGGKGLLVCAPQATMRVFTARARRLWSRVNAHIAAGRRLREALRGGTAAAEAILDPNGTVQHAEGESKEKPLRAALREAVLRVEKSRHSRLREQDPEAATEAWTAMVSARWTLVDRFESGGRRYVVARRNELALPDPRELTPRERAVAHLAALGKANKLIAYELGLAESTVGSYLSVVMRKLGASSRVELIRLLAMLEPK